MVRKIISILNEGLSGLERESQVFGLAQSMIRVQGSVRELLPCLIDTDGDGQYVGLDDIDKLRIYHKLNNAGSTQNLNGSGDNPGDLVNTYSLGMIITWNRKVLDKMPDEILMLVQANMPILIKGIPDMKLARIRVTGANLDTLQIITQEYQSEDIKIPANILMMQVNYNI
jgi:hypothetical protein